MFDMILKKLNARGVFIDHVGQIEDGKKWSACVRKKGTTKMGYGTSTNYEAAIKKAMGSMHDSLDPKGFKDAPLNPEAKKRKRVKIK